MGTLFNQSPRFNHRRDDDDAVSNQVRLIQRVANKTGQSYKEVLETCKMLEMSRQNDLYVNNGDAFDEQMAGFGELIKEAFVLGMDYPSALEKIAMVLEDA